MSTRSGRASRAAAPTSFAPPKANRGWGTSRAYAVGTGRTTPVRGARSRGAKRGALQEKSEAAKRLEASGGLVRRFVRVRRAPLDTLAVGGAGSIGGGGGDGGVKVWKWVAVDDITDPKERKELGLDRPAAAPPVESAEEAAAATAAATANSKEEQGALISAGAAAAPATAAGVTTATAPTVQEDGQQQQENDPTVVEAPANVNGNATGTSGVTASGIRG